MENKDCIFCKIIKGEIPCYKIYEDESCLAFLDIAKDYYGHIWLFQKNIMKIFFQFQLVYLNT